jgi:hypothetical protein
MQTFGIEDKVKRMTLEEKKKFLEGRVTMISLAGSLGKNFRNSTGMVSVITEGGVGKTETHLDGGSKANSTMKK